MFKHPIYFLIQQNYEMNILMNFPSDNINSLIIAFYEECIGSNNNWTLTPTAHEYSKSAGLALEGHSLQPYTTENPPKKFFK